MRTFLCLILLAMVTGGELHAASLRQHRVRGRVTSVDSRRGLITITADDKEAPTTFVVVGDRTRVRHNGTPAALEDLPVGQPIWVFYAQEAGKAVAYEIVWFNPKVP